MNSSPDTPVVLVGAGNLATQLGIALQQSGFNIRQVYSRTEPSAKQLAVRLNVPFVTDIREIERSASVYFFALKDDALPEVLSKMPQVEGLCVHTSGSVPMNVFEGFASRYGVFYPLQTFSKARDIPFGEIPVFIEAKQKADESMLERLAVRISGCVRVLSSEKRKYLHLSAAFACNFTNHMYAIAAGILEKQDIPFNLLLPLIEETASKVKEMHPRDAQTGPAVRNDKQVIDMHLQLLSDAGQRKLYEMISGSISEIKNTEAQGYRE